MSTRVPGAIPNGRYDYSINSSEITVSGKLFSTHRQFEESWAVCFLTSLDSGAVDVLRQVREDLSLMVLTYLPHSI